MAIVNITINTDKIGDTPVVIVDDKPLKNLHDVAFGWTKETAAWISSAKLDLSYCPNELEHLADKDGRLITHKLVEYTSADTSRAFQIVHK